MKLGVNKISKKNAFYNSTVYVGSYTYTGKPRGQYTYRDMALEDLNRNIEVMRGYKFWAFVIITSTILTMISIRAFATPQQQLTAVFSSEAFTGSWAIINEFSFLGFALRWIISAFSIIGLCLIVYSRFVTMLYLSSRNIWDTVYDLKSSSSSDERGFFGILGQAKDAWKAQHSSGFDAVIAFGLCLLPNVKYYSDFNPDRLALYNIDESYNIWRYMLAVAPSTISLIFFFVIGFSGVLMTLMGEIAQSMAVVASNVVAINIPSDVNQIMHIGNGFSFSIGDSQQQPGVLYQDVCEKIYDRLCVKYAITESNYKNTLGNEIQNLIPKVMTAQAVGEALNEKNFQNTANYWSSVSATVNISPSNQKGQGCVGSPIDVHQLLPGLPAGKEFISIYVTSSGPSNPNVFQPQGGNQ